ncbi:hypothetical protein HZB05_01920 [Candidatus Wolfebacteria bacterium]|nr:hypothetical protein [Candidatus Wolfebacteria bacterium]
MAGVVSEEKKAAVKKENIQDPVIKEHLEERDRAEEKYFFDHHNFKLDSASVFCVTFGETNNQNVFDWIAQRKPKYIFLFGTGIIKNPLLSAFDKKVINMHLGLSPYYRGSATNLWPLINNEPELVGATIHLAVSDVDAGNMLGQVRSDIMIGDNCHDIGCKAIIAGVSVIPELLAKYDSGVLSPRAQDLSIGKVYRSKDVTAETIFKIRDNFDSSMIENYFNNKTDRDAAVPIFNI